MPGTSTLGTSWCWRAVVEFRWFATANVSGGCDSALGGHANYVVIDHGDGTSALYLHIDYQGALVQGGTLVAQGDAIAYSESSGLSCGDGGWAGPHLHFQVQRTVAGESWSETILVTFDELRVVRFGPAIATYRPTCRRAFGPYARAHVPRSGRPRRGGLRAAIPALCSRSALPSRPRRPASPSADSCPRPQ